MRSLIVAACICLTAGAQGAGEKVYVGKVLRFQIIAAIRNYGFRDGLRPAQIAISIEGGSQADWMATAAYVAEQSIVEDVTFSEVKVFVTSPWGDLPPQILKRLASAYYAGPNPTKSPWPDKPWLIDAVGHRPTMADIEFRSCPKPCCSQATIQPKR